MRESISRKHCSRGPWATGTLGLQLKKAAAVVSQVKERVGHSPRFVRERWSTGLLGNVPLNTILPALTTEDTTRAAKKNPSKEESEELVKTLLILFGARKVLD